MGTGIGQKACRRTGTGGSAKRQPDTADASGVQKWQKQTRSNSPLRLQGAGVAGKYRCLNKCDAVL